MTKWPRPNLSMREKVDKAFQSASEKTGVFKVNYEQAYEGEWIQPKRSGWLMRCCDCKLVHTIDFRIRNGRIQIRPARDNLKTAASRRGLK